MATVPLSSRSRLAREVRAEPDDLGAAPLARAAADADALERRRHQRRAVRRRAHPPADDRRGLLARVAVADPADRLTDRPGVHLTAQARQAGAPVGLAV